MNNKITIEEATKQISEGFSSIYSKDDVLHLLSVLETNSGGFEIDDSQIKELAENIANEISDAGIDVINDYELSMNYREVELDSIDFSINEIKSVIEDTVSDFIKAIKEEAEAE
jgi:hypothetical protein